jgi:multicomponent Na+:H+ antiporter subunit B
MTSLILCTATRLLLPLLLLFSVFVLLRGHNEPGGGFVGGLIAAAAFVLHLIAYDVKETRRVLPLDPRVLIALGLLIAWLSGAVALIFGLPFMTGHWTNFTVEALGELDIGSPFFFDVGVYLVVFGVTLTIIFSLAEE